MKFGIRILPKKGFLDPQGRAVETLLQKQHPVSQVQVGKWIELQIEETDSEKAFGQAQQMAREVLTNPMTESFEIERLEV